MGNIKPFTLHAVTSPTLIVISPVFAQTSTAGLLRALAPLAVRRLLVDLQAVNDGRQLAEDFKGPLVELQLRGDEVGEVAERFRRV